MYKHFLSMSTIIICCENFTQLDASNNINVDDRHEISAKISNQRCSFGIFDRIIRIDLSKIGGLLGKVGILVPAQTPHSD